LLVAATKTAHFQLQINSQILSFEEKNNKKKKKTLIKQNAELKDHKKKQRQRQRPQSTLITCHIKYHLFYSGVQTSRL